MIFSAKDWGCTIEVLDVNDNLKKHLSDEADISLWNGEGWGEGFEGAISIPTIGFYGTAIELLQKHGLKLSVNESDVLDWENETTHLSAVFVENDDFDFEDEDDDFIDWLEAEFNHAVESAGGAENYWRNYHNEDSIS